MRYSSRMLRISSLLFAVAVVECCRTVVELLSSVATLTEGSSENLESQGGVEKSPTTM